MGMMLIKVFYGRWRCAIAAMKYYAFLIAPLGRIPSHRERLLALSFIMKPIIDHWTQDSAEWYENESECGQAILDFCKRSNIPRSEIFFTTKLRLNNGYDNVKNAIQKSLDECGLGYIDLYLIHGPIGGPQARKESWRAICDAQKGGKLKSIGVSTFGVGHLQEIVDSKAPLPAVNQVGVWFTPRTFTADRAYSNCTDRLAPFHDQNRRGCILQKARHRTWGIHSTGLCIFSSNTSWSLAGMGPARPWHAV